MVQGFQILSIENDNLLRSKMSCQRLDGSSRMSTIRGFGKNPIDAGRPHQQAHPT
jgi:hypothetical protein